MNFSLALPATTLAVAESGGGDNGIASQLANLRRRLSYEVIAGYSPGTQVRRSRLSILASMLFLSLFDRLIVCISLTSLMPSTARRR